ncbi:MAG TPA: PIN domain-containing protein [Silvibacterium sp.]|nr:PIN domain-containing protein [Silvibacterium sp.]
MTTFFDTSVFVSACQRNHECHAWSLNAFASANKTSAACSAHSLAEVYAVTTGMPREYKVAPEDASLFLRQISERCQLIALDAEEYLAAVDSVVHKQLPGGIIYDALLVACARKSQADRILTWNLKHFKLLAPDLAERIITP